MTEELKQPKRLKLKENNEDIPYVTKVTLAPLGKDLVAHYDQFVTIEENNKTKPYILHRVGIVDDVEIIDNFVVYSLISIEELPPQAATPIKNKKRKKK